MKPYYEDDWLTILEGDCRAVLPMLAAESVDCVVTSPPYWQLRDYGTATWSGGDETCDHLQSLEATAGGRVGDNGRNREASGGTFHGGPPSQKLHAYKNTCGKCGATRQDSQLGLERTPEEYVANMVAVFAEVRRVLKPGGTCWLNLGDSYNSASGQYGHREGEFLNPGGREPVKGQARNRNGSFVNGLKPKDLVGIPWRVAFALQADGWYLRSDVIWNKPNPMPESVTDRPTKAHEYLFLLTKAPRYYFDADAVREGSSPASRPQGPNNGTRQKIVERHEGIPREKRGGKGLDAVPYMAGRNIRSVWTIATVPYGSTTIGDAEGGHRDTLSPDCPVHSLRAIRRSRQTVGDDGLRDHLLSRSPRSGSGPAPMPSDGLFASLDLDSSDQVPSIPDSQLPQSSDATIPGSAHASRTPTQPTPADGLASDAGTVPRTSHTLAPTTVPGQAETTGSPSATGRSGRESRMSAESEPLGSASLGPESRTPDTDARPEGDELRQHMGASSSAGDSARRDPDAQTTARTHGICTCPDYSASHFAVFPPELPERCIKAGSSEKGVCPECGAPWERVVERKGDGRLFSRDQPEGASSARRSDGSRLTSGTGHRTLNGTTPSYRPPEVTTNGWEPTCTCGATTDGSQTLPVQRLPGTASGGDRGAAGDLPELPARLGAPSPAVILDPFAGSGTVGLVANRLSRRAILIDLNPEYLRQQMTRNAQTPLGLGAA